MKEEEGDDDLPVLYGPQVGQLDEEITELNIQRARLMHSHQERVRSVPLQVDLQYELTRRGTGHLLSKTDLLEVLQRPTEDTPPCMLWEN